MKLTSDSPPTPTTSKGATCRVCARPIAAGEVALFLPWRNLGESHRACGFLDAEERRTLAELVAAPVVASASVWTPAGLSAPRGPLDRLYEAGLVAAERVDDDPNDARRRFTLTATGRALVARVLRRAA